MSDPGTTSQEAMATGSAGAAAGTGGTSMRGRMGTVAAASAIALLAGQIISLGQTVALARLLTPEQIGLFAAGSVTTNFVSNVVEGGLRAGLIHRDDRIADASETVFRATLATGLVMSLASLAAAPVIGMLFDSRSAGVVAASMAGGILLFSLTNVPEALLQREFSVRRRLIVGPTVATVFALVSVTLAALGFGVWSLVIGTYASTVAWVLTLWLICDWRPGRGRADMEMYREMVRYGAPLAIGTFAEQFVKAVQAVVTGRFLSVHSLGLFRYGERMAQIPVGVIIDVGANSLFPAYARISSEPERFRAAYLQALGLVVTVGAFMAGGLAALGVPLVVVVLGETWRGAGVVLVFMAGLGLGTALSTSAEALKGAGRTGLLNWVTMIDVVLGISLVVVMTHLLGLVGVGLSISITSLVGGLCLVAMTRSVLGLGWGQTLGAIVPQVVVAVVTAGVVYGVETVLFRSSEQPVWLGLLLLLADGLIYLVVFGVGLRLLAPATFGLVAGVVASGLTGVRRLLGHA